MKERTIEFIVEILSDNGNIDQEQVKNINESTSFKNDLGFSSFDLATLTVMVEDEYDVDIFEEGIITTVGEMWDLLNEA